jgi:hypothetical protein
MSPDELKIHNYRRLVTDAERVLYLFRSVARALCVWKRGSAASTQLDLRQLKRCGSLAQETPVGAPVVPASTLEAATEPCTGCTISAGR